MVSTNTEITLKMDFSFSTSIANPIIRNAQEQRQLTCLSQWLDAQGYKLLPQDYSGSFIQMPPGTYAFHMNIQVGGEDGLNPFNISVDVVIMRRNANEGDLPFLIEAKSAGDFINTNKRRKEEAQKVNQLRASYGQDVEFVLFLCGYFDTSYLGYEAAERIDWVWEHRLDDFLEFGL